MRLIDADAFKEMVGIETKLRRTICDVIDTRPTAYNVDKVVEQLEEDRNDCRDCSDINEDYYLGMYQAYQYAIEIVRRGGAE